MNHTEEITSQVKKSKLKTVSLITFVFIGSYASIFIIYPSSYWTEYFNLPFPKLVLDILGNLVFCILILTFSLFIDRVLDKKISWMAHPLKRLLVQILFQILGALIVIISLAIIFYTLGDYVVTLPVKTDIRQALYTVISIILWSLMVSALNTGDFLLKNWKNATIKAAEYKVNAAENKQLLAEIELQALKLQLDPHFVFNNLSVLSELILKDQQLGYDFTENFAKVYRYLLVNSKKPLVQLHEELQFLDAYLFLINNRIGDGCAFQINIDQSKLNMLIPPITLQLFIENTLKHNRTEEENPLIVHIYSNNNDELVVSNTLLPLIKKVPSTGIGLKNIISRYALLSDRKVSVEENNKTFTVKVPLI
ncbi:histidine kinase [Flavobacterium sp. LS1R49]|uniref:Histidine kinase n=1 Tax=Flavobacterium shii TaxID=2987687 RepID=A0A9X2YWK9_9FLAO|nr:histidine kinase [Flavobacterium shii]MCV9929733.1 histidine kinase [Flavobacterium shii]